MKHPLFNSIRRLSYLSGGNDECKEASLRSHVPSGLSENVAAASAVLSLMQVTKLNFLTYTPHITLRNLIMLIIGKKKS